MLLETLRRPVFCHSQIYGIDETSRAATSASNISTGDHVFNLCGALVNIEVEGESEAAGEIATVTPGLHLFFDTVCDGQVVHLLERGHGISILGRCSKPVCCVKVLNVDGVTGSFYFKYVNRTR
ncbi:hypothetical protein QVD17_08612 [Tagetes erecta]|uniref:Uncharacterized protein n=1 Tax=Tagetes erecta TaxID=13708 RepID=A0AAD8P4L3_TARER|nr:hypothetical protein QVD17_08612 [Tagetes erecta]